MFEKSQQKEKQHWEEEKPKLDNVRKLRGIYYIDPVDKEINETLKKLEGSTYGRCNAVQRTKGLRKLILEGAKGSTTRKSR